MKATLAGKAREKVVPAKKTVKVWLDSDVVAWLKKDGAGYQTRANKILRERMMKDLAGR